MQPIRKQNKHYQNIAVKNQKSKQQSVDIVCIQQSLS